MVFKKVLKILENQVMTESRGEKTSANCYLVLDIGTHAVRAALVKKHPTCVPKILFLSKKNYELSRIPPLCVEQDADDILLQTRSVLDDALRYADVKGICVLSAGIAIQRSTVVAWAASGKSLHPALSWQDTRGQAAIEAIQMDDEKVATIKRISGLPVSAHYGATKISWLRTHISEKQSYYCGPLVSFLLFNLLKSHPYICDESNVGRTQLYDIQKRRWSQELCDTFEINLSDLPKVVPVEFEYGDLDLDFQDQNFFYKHSIPLRIVCGDQNSAYQYMSWVGDQVAGQKTAFMAKSRTVAINSGSGAFVLTDDIRNVKNDSQFAEEKHKQKEARPLNIDQRFLQSLVFSNSELTQYVLEGTVNGVGTALSWIFDQWVSLGGVIDETVDDKVNLNQELSPKGVRTEKLFFKNLDLWCKNAKSTYIFLNTVGGIGSPYWVSRGEASFYKAEKLKECFTNNFERNSNSDVSQDVSYIDTIDLGPKISRSDLDDNTIADASVAVMESIIFLIAINMEGMLATQPSSENDVDDHLAKNIVIGGGVSRSDYLCQGLSNLLGVRVSRIADHDATTLGVATLLSKASSRLELTEQQSSQGDRVDINLDEFSPQNNGQGQRDHLFDHYRYFKQLMNTLL